MKMPISFAVGDRVMDVSTGREGRVAVIHPGHAGQRAYAWIQRWSPDGTVEREASWLDDLRSLKSSAEP